MGANKSRAETRINGNRKWEVSTPLFPLLHLSSLVEILYRILQDFLRSCKFTQDPTQDPKWHHVVYDPTQDPVKSFRILLKIVQDPV